MTSQLYPTLLADSSLEAHMSDQQDTLQTQLSTEVNKYLQESAENGEMNVNYFDGQHMATNTVNHQQIDDVAEIGKDNIPELVDNDTGEMCDNNTEQYIQYNEGLETIPEESDEDLLVTAQGDGDDGDTILYIQGDLEDEQFNTAIDDTSNNLMIVMGKPSTYYRIGLSKCTRSN